MESGKLIKVETMPREGEYSPEMIDNLRRMLGTPGMLADLAQVTQHRGLPRSGPRQGSGDARRRSRDSAASR